MFVVIITANFKLFTVHYYRWRLDLIGAKYREMAWMLLAQGR
jgi:hypothetical protein